MCYKFPSQPLHSSNKLINTYSQDILFLQVAITTPERGSLGYPYIKTESTKKLSNYFNLQWAKIWYQNNLKNFAFFFTFFKDLRCNKSSVTSHTKENFSWKSEKMNVKFHKNRDYAGKILKISCVRSNSVKVDIHFLGLP